MVQIKKEKEKISNLTIKDINTIIIALDSLKEQLGEFRTEYKSEIQEVRCLAKAVAMNTERITSLEYWRGLYNNILIAIVCASVSLIGVAYVVITSK